MLTQKLHRFALPVLVALSALALLISPSARAESLSPFEQQVFDLVNQQRAANGLAPLRLDWRLVNVARAHNALMAQRGELSHQLSGEKPVCSGDDRLRDGGYPWLWCAENVAAGQGSPQQVMDAWMTSAGHRTNILNPNLRDMGIAFVQGGKGPYGTWWTQDFGSTGETPAAPVPPPAGTQPALNNTLLTAGQQRQVMQFNPGAALQKRIFADGFVPNSAEFTVLVGGTSYAGQRAESLESGRVRIYYARSGDWGNVRFVEQGSDDLSSALLAAGQQRQGMQFNPGAALQKRIFGDGFVPNSGEFTVNVGGADYAGQRAESLGSGRVRIYYASSGDWGNVQIVDRP